MANGSSPSALSPADNTFMLTPRYFDDYNNGRDTVKDPSYTFFEEL